MRFLRERRAVLRGDDGFTLVELMVYIVLLGIVMSIVVATWVSITKAQTSVQNMSNAANSGQAALNGITSAITNSSAVSVTAPTAGNQLLLTRTALPGSTATWQCEAWYYQSAANSSTGVGGLYFKTSSSAITAPSSSALSSWTTLVTGVTPPTGSTTIFNAPLALSTATLVNFSFYAAVAGQKPVLLASTASTQLGNTGSSPCF
jgi:prepilin-type N-terminal cleavage/methylation domain-containing protein